MRRIVFVMVVVIPAFLASGGAATAKAVSTRLAVAPNIWCANPMSGETCATEFTANIGDMYVNDGTGGTARVTSLSSGAVVPLEFGSSLYVDPSGDPPTFDTSAPLPSGRYEATVVIDTPGKWECSEYDPNGCTWMSGDHRRFDWRFIYSAGATAAYPQYHPPVTATPGQVSAPRPTRRLLKGLVESRILQSDYTLTPWQPQSHRAVTVQMKARGRWVTKAKLRTAADGHFRVSVRVARGSRHYWRVIVYRSGKSPGHTSTTNGKI